MNYVYLLLCNNQALYCGWTNDLQRRIDRHNAGKGAKYTAAHRPVQLVASWTFETASQARKIEAQVKKLSHQQKLELVQNPTLIHKKTGP